MSWLASCVLRLIHVFYSLVIALSSIRSRSQRLPLPLAAARTKFPTHLALVLTHVDETEHESHEDLEEALIECVRRAATWCQACGISRLTVYDRQGVLGECSELMEKYLSPPAMKSKEKGTANGIAYPLTPPLSDDSDSSIISPLDDSLQEGLRVVTIHPTGRTHEKRRLSRTKSGTKRRRSPCEGKSPQLKAFTLHIVSRDSGKPAIASVANSLLRSTSRTRVGKPDPVRSESFKLTIDDLQYKLEGEHGFAPPDLMIVHHVTPPKLRRIPLELYGFPPWQIRLTEIHHNKYDGRRHWLRPPCVILDEVDFRQALDEFSGSEMRLGK
ncbi:hypothetical protein EW146_g3880 [Bondarzewia mesenterica]|uniref:ditrans,polycis-polyprenyl diphosphate synthase [(2E,6E)-farnesyldiphosphate specific] n=1 Tax=Bondarzewia mesenterica TaxID=1095465 RepID=A0A4S4LYC9_9AGAM|nr:hypothetical protein EW146_g3880 [Bondarzewia mesenterica]